MEHLNMLGQPCPIPVINAKKALAKPNANGVSVQVDNFVAVQNLEKMAKGYGYAFSYTTASDNDYTVSITGSPSNPAANKPVALVNASTTAQPANASSATVFISSNTMGKGADELGEILIKGFIFSLNELATPPATIIFINSGAKLTTKGANTVPDLQTLAAKGTQIFTCGTCANYFQLTDDLAVGAITDMMNITNMLASATHLITI